MTRTSDTERALTDVSLLRSAEWCDVSRNYHRDVDDDVDVFEPAREHVIEFDPVVASTGQPTPATRDQPHALVCVSAPEKSYYDHVRSDDPTVTLAETGHPHFTPAEARQLAVTLLAAADQADEILAWRTSGSRAA